MALVNAPSGASKEEPPMIAPPGTSRPKAQVVTPWGAGGATVPVVILPVTVLEISSLSAGRTEVLVVAAVVRYLLQRMTVDAG